jgi:predicted PurR-regulated permease PerM
MDRRTTEVRHEEAVPDDFVRRAATTIGLLIVGGVLLTVVILAVDVFLIIFAGVLLGIFLLALRDGLTRYTGIPGGWALTIVVIVLLALLGGLGVLMGPQLAQQFREFQERLPQIVEQVEGYVQGLPGGEQAIEQVEQLGENGDFEGMGGMAGGIVEAVGTVFSITVRTLLLLGSFLFIGLFIAIHPKLYSDGIVLHLPLRWRPRAREVLAELDSALRWFLVARALAMLFVGVATAIALTLLGVPLALLLAVIAGLLTFIPYLGPIIATVPIVLVALLAGPLTALYTLIVYTIIEQIEGNIFEPVVLKRILHLPPVITLVAQLLGGTLFGMLGLALATPFAAVMHVVVRMVYRASVLGDPVAQKEEREEKEEKAEKEERDD